MERITAVTDPKCAPPRCHALHDERAKRRNSQHANDALHFRPCSSALGMQLADLERARAEKAAMTPEQLAEMKRKNVRLD